MRNLKKFTALLLALALCMGMTTLALAEDYESKTYWSISHKTSLTIDKVISGGGFNDHVPLGATVTYTAVNDGPLCLSKLYGRDDNDIAIHWSYDPAAGTMVKSSYTDSNNMVGHWDCLKLASGETYTFTITEELMEDFAVVKQLPEYYQYVEIDAGRFTDSGFEIYIPIIFDYPDTTPAAPETPSVPETPAAPEQPADYKSETFTSKWSESNTSFTIDKTLYDSDMTLHAQVGATVTYTAAHDGPLCMAASRYFNYPDLTFVHWSYDPAAGTMVRNTTFNGVDHSKCPQLTAGTTYTFTITEEIAESYSVFKQVEDPLTVPTLSILAGEFDKQFGYELGVVLLFDDSDTTPVEPNAPAEPTAPATRPSAGTAYPSTQTVDLDGKQMEFQMYALKDDNGNPTNYVKVRDLALALNSTAAQFSVDWDGAVNLVAGAAYTANGNENSTPFSGERAYKIPTNPTNVNGAASDLQAIVLTDDNGGDYTYYQLRDLGRKLGFNVDWSAEKGVFIETDKPYSGT